jgi:adenylate kinase family enzyme
MESKNNSKKIILLLFPPIINKFNFSSEEKGMFFELGKKRLKKEPFQQLSSEEIFKLSEIDYNQEAKEFIQHNARTKSILVNYPHNEQQFASLNTELAQTGKKINNIILLNISNYELISNIKEEYLICPLCEKIYQKEKLAKDPEKFICPQDNEYEFALADMKKFIDYSLEHHLKSTEQIIKKFLSENKLSSPSSIIQLTVQKKEDIFNGETQKNLLKVIESL